MGGGGGKGQKNTQIVLFIPTLLATLVGLPLPLFPFSFPSSSNLCSPSLRIICPKYATCLCLTIVKHNCLLPIIVRISLFALCVEDTVFKFEHFMRLCLLFLFEGYLVLLLQEVGFTQGILIYSRYVVIVLFLPALF